MEKIYEEDGKKYIRVGSCNGCGECCLGWEHPCPYLKDNRCLIHEVSEQEWPKDAPHTRQAMHDFPDGPAALENPKIRNKCGYAFKEIKKILIACATCEEKEYCFDKWIAAVRAQDYPDFEVLVVDNTMASGFFNRWCNQIPMEHLPLIEGPNRRIALTMEYIRQVFLKGPYSHWFNVESDVIIPPNALTFMVTHAGDFDWLSHIYPARDPEGGDNATLQTGFGCSLFSRHIMQESFEGAPDDPTTDSWWWWSKIIANWKTKKYKTMEFWNSLELKHYGSNQ